MTGFSKLIQSFLYRDITFAVGGFIILNTIYLCFIFQPCLSTTDVFTGNVFHLFFDSLLIMSRHKLLLIMFLAAGYFVGLAVNEILSYLEDRTVVLRFRPKLKIGNKSILKSKIEKEFGEIPLFDLERIVYFKQIGFVLANAFFVSAFIAGISMITEFQWYKLYLALTYFILIIPSLIIGIYKRKEEEETIKQLSEELDPTPKS